MSEPAPRGTLPLRVAITVGVVSLVGGLLLSAFGPEFTSETVWGTSTHSESAVGHGAWLAMLEELDIPVITRQSDRERFANSEALWVVAEPDDDALTEESRETLQGVAYESANILVVLPKRRAHRSWEEPRWIRSSRYKSDHEVGESLGFLQLGEIEILRTEHSPSTTWTINDFEINPTFPTEEAMQLIQGVDVIPRLACAEGTLIGEIQEDHRRIVVIADPDLVANAGLGLGENAVLVHAALEIVRPPDSPVQFDEVIHGLRTTPSIWRELFSFPLLLLMLHGLAAVSLLVWGGSKRFGRSARDDAPFERSQRFLVENTADLMQLRAGHDTTLSDYFTSSVRAVAAHMGMDPTIGRKETARLLNRVAAARGASDNVTSLNEHVQRAKKQSRQYGVILGVAGRIHRWREEMVHGT